MTDILAQLHDASWRGIAFPFTGQRDFGFQQDQEQHRFIFRDEKLIESLGAENPTYRYTIPFREDMFRGQWVNLYTKVYPQFLEACLDRSNGILDDSAHGPIQCKVASFQETLDVGKKDGVDVQVTFIVSPDEDFDRQEIGTLIGTVQGAQNLQNYFDRQALALDEDTKRRLRELNKGSTNGKVNPLDAATSAMNQIEVAGNKVQASFGDVAYRFQKFDDAFARLRDPTLQPMRTSARMLALTAMDLQRVALRGTAERNRKIAVYSVPSAIGKMALAGQLGMSVQDLIRMNPSIARSPSVQQGTQVAYFAR